MPVTNAGTLPPPPEPEASSLRYDHSGDQPWLAGVEIACERCGFAETLDEGVRVCSSGHGVQTAYHFVYKDKSRPGWGTGIFVCPCCKKQIFFQRELPVNELAR